MRHDLPPPPDDPDDHRPGRPSRTPAGDPIATTDGAAATSGSDADADGAGGDPVAVLAAFAADYHRLLRHALTVFTSVSHGRVAATAGLSAAVLLELDHRLPVPVVRQLETVAARLDVLPDCARLYAAGVLEVTDLAGIVRAAAPLSGPALAELDRWAGCHAAALADQGLLHLLEGDVADRAGQLRAPGWARRQERRRTETSQVRLQQDFDGGGMVYADLDVTSFTTVATSIETVAGPPCPDMPRPTQRAAALVAIAEHALTGTHTAACGGARPSGPAVGDGGDGGDGVTGADAAAATATPAQGGADGGPTGPGSRVIGAVTSGCASARHADTDDPAGQPVDPTTTTTTTTTTGGGSSGGGSGAGAARPVPGQVRLPRRPRVRMTVVVDLAQATPDRFALVQATTGLRDTPTISARLADTLAAHSQLLVQLTDGRRPLAELAAVDLPAPVRRAVQTRDRGCRAPGCRRPVGECDVHHLVRRTDGGPHDPDNCVLLCRRHHRDVDRHAWAMSLDPTTGVLAWTHPGTGQTYRTAPHGARPPAIRPDHVPLAPWEAPPVPPPPPDHHDPGPDGPHDHGPDRDPGPDTSRDPGIDSMHGLDPRADLPIDLDLGRAPDPGPDGPHDGGADP